MANTTWSKSELNFGEYRRRNHQLSKSWSKLDCDYICGIILTKILIYRMETANGISTRETGNLKNVGSPEGPVNVKEGSYSWTSPEGQHFTVSYVADEFGYRASGAHLPTPPPIPAEIAASLRGASCYGASCGHALHHVAPASSHIRIGGY
jgi:Insect cuticle protein